MKAWTARIEDSASHMDLLAAARDFLDSFEPGELALIPERARPHRIKGVDDLTFWHGRLVDCYCATPLRNVEMEKVREMLRFFAFALQRAYELDGEPPITGHEAAASLFSERSVPALFTSAMSGASTEH